jgi:hypothetical protein
MHKALAGVNLKKIRFKRDPGNHESMESYEGYLLEEDGISGTATIFVPDLVNSLLNVTTDDFEEIVPEMISNLCTLKSASARILSELGHITCEVDLARLDDISSIEQLECYLTQFGLCDSETLSIYRSSYINE